jgi:tricorn protease
MLRRFLSSSLLVLALLGAMPAAQDTPTRLLRQPAISRELIAFVYAGDIWLVPIAGGYARQLTSGEGEELFPRFSPDGRTVAFTGQYDGRRQVYTIPVSGGTPAQLTFYNDVAPMPPRGGIDNQVLGWTPDGTRVLFNAHRTPWSERNARPYLIPATGGTEQPLPMAEGAGGWLSPDGKRYAYTPIMREFRTWKRYHGGRAQDIWIYDLAANTSEQITTYDGTDNQPVWLGDTIYFTSDRAADQKLNLWAYDVRTKQQTQVTTHDRYDVLWPSGGPAGVVYENGGWIYRFDPATAKTARVDIHVAGDLRKTLPMTRTVKSEIQSIESSPTGRRALIEAHGEVFTAPAKEGEIRNLTSTPGVREVSPTWSPDGRTIAYLSDRTGEYEIYVRPADGSGAERRVTTDGGVWRFPPAWSPDSKKLAYGDKSQRLRMVTLATGATVDVDKGQFDDLTTYRWSPDSRWLAYEKQSPATRLSAIWIYSVDDGKTHQLTSGQASDTEPIFDPRGRYLYFLSNRDFRLTFSGFEFNYVYTEPTRVYVGLLSKTGPALFLPESDEEPARSDDTLRPPRPPGQPPPSAEPARPPDTAQPEPEKSSPERKSESPGRAEPAAPKQDAKPETGAPSTTAAPSSASGPDAQAPAAFTVRVDVDGFERRVRAIPGGPADIRSLQANERAVLYLVGQGPRVRLVMYDIDDKKESTILTGIAGYELSRDGKKVLFRTGADYGFADVKADQKATEGLLALDRLATRVDPRVEWKQMYADAWRILRDWYYDPSLGGLNWTDVRDRYAELLPFVADRNDLDYVFGEMAGELGAGHVYVQSPATQAMKRVEGGLLGADIVPDAGVYRVVKIYAGENWQDDFRSPLTEPGVRVTEGDYILEVVGVSTEGVDNFYRLLEAKGTGAVTLLVNAKPTTEGARAERVRPIASELGLRYLDWVESRRRIVEKASNGRIGYIHIPNTAVEGNRELFKGFYSQATKEALVIDDRWNGGGFIPDRMIVLVARRTLIYWARRGVEPSSTPQFVVDGPKVCLINGQSSSGGDAFPYYFKKLGLGPLIGTRTRGGLIGISGNPPLLDGGSITAPTFRFFGTGGAWEVEGVGVSPDIEVVDAPHLVAQGRDPSLEKGIEVLLKELQQHPPRKVVSPRTPSRGTQR